MKKLLSVLLTFVLLLCFVSCGNKDTEKLKKENEELEEKIEELEEEFENLKKGEAAETTATDTSDETETAATDTSVEEVIPEEKVYTIVSDNAFPPFESYDAETKTYVGIDMDIFAAIAEDQGFKYNMLNVGFDPALGQVQAGQADGVIAGMSITEMRKEVFDFSDGYFEDGQILVVHSNSDIATMEDLKGKVVATKVGTMGLEYAEANAERYGYTTMMFAGSAEMYQAIINGTCAACFEDVSVIAFAIQNERLPLKFVGEVINPYPYGFAVKKGENAELIEMFNKGLRNIKENGKYAEILAKYGIMS